MKLKRKTLAAILAVRSQWIRDDATGASFTIVCTVEEGIACRFAQADWNDSALAALADSIVDELGWKTVEHSAQRQAVLRCLVPGNDLARAVCEVDRGDGFVPIPIEVD